MHTNLSMNQKALLSQHQLCMKLKTDFDSDPFVKYHFTLKTIRSGKNI